MADSKIREKKSVGNMVKDVKDALKSRKKNKAEFEKDVRNANFKAKKIKEIGKRMK